MTEIAETKHDLTITTFRSYFRAECSCGWVSGIWTSSVGATLAFGKHMRGED